MFFFVIDVFVVYVCIEFFFVCSCNNNVYFYCDVFFLNKIFNIYLLYIFEGL